MNIINVKTGKANMQTALSECYVFFTPRPEMDGENCKEDFLGKAAREFRGRSDAPVREHGSPVIVPSLNNMPAESGGSFAQATYQVKDGVIMKLQCKRRTGWDGTMRTQVMFIKAREHAAHRQLKFRPVASNALTMDWLGVQGRFDIISLSEAEAFGAHITLMTQRLAEGGDDNLIEVTVIEEETLAPVGFVPVGDGKLMPMLKRRRRIEAV